MQNKMLSLTILIIGLVFFACGDDNQQAQTGRDDGIAADQSNDVQVPSNQPSLDSQPKDTTRTRTDDGQVGGSRPTSVTRANAAAGTQPKADLVRNNQTAPAPRPEATADQKVFAPKITFIELGSVNCIPCKAMQPVMRSIERKYGEQIQVIFYDVWTPEQQHYARDFKIRVIPTQVFVDQHGSEILRHEGFFAEAEIDRFLQARGLKVLPGL